MTRPWPKGTPEPAPEPAWHQCQKSTQILRIHGLFKISRKAAVRLPAPSPAGYPTSCTGFNGADIAGIGVGRRKATAAFRPAIA
jgi:hypothetical protein